MASREYMAQERGEGKGKTDLSLWSKMDALTVHVSRLQRIIAEEDYSCSCLEELINQEKKVQTDLEGELQQLRLQIQTLLEKSPQLAATNATLQSSYELVREQLGDQEQENLGLEDELYALTKRLEAFQRTAVAQLDSVKVRYGDRVMDSSELECRGNISQLDHQKMLLISEIDTMKTDKHTQALEEWNAFKEMVVQLATLQVNIRAQQSSMDYTKSVIQKHKMAIKALQEDMGVLNTQKQQSSQSKNAPHHSSSNDAQLQMMAQRYDAQSATDGQVPDTQQYYAPTMADRQMPDRQRYLASTMVDEQRVDTQKYLTPAKTEEQRQNTQEYFAPAVTDGQKQNTQGYFAPGTTDGQQQDTQRYFIPAVTDRQRQDQQHFYAPALTEGQRQDLQPYHVLGTTQQKQDPQQYHVPTMTEQRQDPQQYHAPTMAEHRQNPQQYHAPASTEGQKQNSQQFCVQAPAGGQRQNSQQYHASAVTGQKQGPQQYYTPPPDGQKQDPQRYHATAVIEGHRQDPQQCYAPSTGGEKQDLQQYHSPTVTGWKQDSQQYHSPTVTEKQRKDTKPQTLAHQRRDTPRPKTMFSSNLSLLKLQIPKYAERKRIHRSSTQMSNKGKEKSELVSTMTELPQCQPITAEDNQPSIPSSHTSQSCITPCTLKTDRNYSTRNDYNICGQARFISEVGRRDASHPSQSAALASERGTGESNSFTREAKNELPVNTGTQQNDSMAFPTFKKGITTDGNLSSECQTPVCTTSTVVGESSLQVLDQVHMSPKRLIPEALSTAGSVTTVANTKSSESHSSHLSLCSMQTESMDMSKMDESLPSSQGFNLTDDSGIDNTQMTSTSDMVETFSYPRVSAGQLHTSSLIVEPPASRNVSAVSSPLSSNFASAPATAGVTRGSLYLSVTSPRTEETLNKDIPASVQSSLLPGNPMFYSSPLSLTNATQLSSSSTAQNLQTSQSSESLYSLSPILQPGGSHVNIHPSSNSVSTSASSAFMLGGDSFDDGMGSGAMSLFGSPVAQTNAEVPHQGQSGVTFSLFGESSSPKPDSGGFFSFNFGSDADNNPESGSSGFLSSLFSSPTKDSNSQGGGAGFKFF